MYACCLRCSLWQNLMYSAYPVNWGYANFQKTAWVWIILILNLRTCTVVIHTILWKFANLRLTSPSGPIRYTILTGRYSGTLSAGMPNEVHINNSTLQNLFIHIWLVKMHAIVRYQSVKMIICNWSTDDHFSWLIPDYRVHLYQSCMNKKVLQCKVHQYPCNGFYNRNTKEKLITV